MIKVALIGTSMRIRPFVEALKKNYSDTHQVCALLDIDAGKMRAFAENLELKAPCFQDFEELCAQAAPDLLLISTVDNSHCEYLVRALDRRISCICEKPLCVDAGQCRKILQAQAHNSGVFAATSHNARYHIAARTVKKMLDDGVIGRVNSVHYAEMLDLVHGTSYFRRWNRVKKNSGGLAVHKASHHFDKLNWWLNSRAAEVTAAGGLKCFGVNASPFHGENCRSCPHTAECRFAVPPEHYRDYELFYKYAAPDSYKPDLCVFSPEIDIEDFLSAGIKFANGVYCNYTLAAHCNFEGEDIFFEGDLGRIEMRRRKGCNAPEKSSVLLYRFGTAEPENIELKLESGTHGGADARLYEDLFGNAGSGRLATLDDGIQAVLTGVAVNESIRTGRKIDVQSLL